MNKKLTYTTFLVATLLLMGCATTGTNDITLMTTVAKSATYVGTRVWLDSHPQDQEIFVQVQFGLKTLIAAGQFDAAELTALMKQLPVRELRGDTGAIIVDTAVVLWDSYGRQLANLDKDKVFETYILPVAKAISAGMDMALPPPIPR